MNDRLSLRTLVMTLVVTVASLGGFTTASLHAKDFVIKANEHSRGDLVVKNRNVIIYGVVEGDVIQKGKGSVIVLGGLVKGKIKEFGPGSVKVEKFGHKAQIEDGIYENQKGNVIIYSSLVKGKVEESGKGFVEVQGREAVVDGSVYESGPGYVCVFDYAKVYPGGIYESGDGGSFRFSDFPNIPYDIVIDYKAYVEGKITQKGFAGIAIVNHSKVKGKINKGNGFVFVSRDSEVLK